MTLNEFTTKLILLGFSKHEYPTDFTYVYYTNENNKLTITSPKPTSRYLNIIYRVRDKVIKRVALEEDLDSLLEDIITFIEFGII